jgi:hypothetical protein
MLPSERKREAERIAAGVSPKKWAVMSREERRKAVAAAIRQDRRRGKT